VTLIAARFIQFLAAPIVALVLEALSWVFWLAAWAAAAASLHGRDGYVRRPTKGALVAFGVLEWYVACEVSLCDVHGDGDVSVAEER